MTAKGAKVKTQRAQSKELRRRYIQREARSFMLTLLEVLIFHFELITFGRA
jgi:hypothetical protein